MSRHVRCIPSTDDAFRDAAVAALASIDARIGAHQIELMLCDLLIDRYPQVDVHRQAELARSFDEDVWYVYRDGRPREGSEGDPD
jgi:hypothetical protein